MFTKTDIEKYFVAEKLESLVFIFIGVAAIIIALVGLLIRKTQYWKGAAIPLIAIALIQVVVGYTVYARSDRQRTDIVYAFDMNPDKLENEELPRMHAVNRNFVIYRWVEILLFVAGLVLVFTCKNDAGKQFWLGLGLALALQAAVMLIADFFAEQRALNYTGGLQAFLKK